MTREVFELAGHAELKLGPELPTEFRVRWTQPHFRFTLLSRAGIELLSLIPPDSPLSGMNPDLIVRIDQEERETPRLTLIGTVFPRYLRARRIELVVTDCVLDGVLESVELIDVITSTDAVSELGASFKASSPGLRWGGAAFELRFGTLHARSAADSSFEIVDARNCDIRSDSLPLLNIQRATLCEFSGVRLEISSTGAAQGIGGSVILVRCNGLLDAGDKHLEMAGAGSAVDMYGGQLHAFRLSQRGDLDLMQLLMAAEQARVFNPNPSNFGNLIRSRPFQDQPALAEALFSVVRDSPGDPEVADKAAIELFEVRRSHARGPRRVVFDVYRLVGYGRSIAVPLGGWIGVALVVSVWRLLMTLRAQDWNLPKHFGMGSIAGAVDVMLQALFVLFTVGSNYQGNLRLGVGFFLAVRVAELIFGVTLIAALRSVVRTRFGARE
jgi:hypothetical protein